MDYSTKYGSAYHSADYEKCLTKPTDYAVQNCRNSADMRLTCTNELNVRDCVHDKRMVHVAKQRRRESEEQAVKVKKRKKYGAGKWSVREREDDPIDDSRVVSVSLEAESSSVNSRGTQPLLFLRCKSNETSMYISWEDYVTESTMVTHRFDKGVAITREWPSSTDKTASFYYGPALSIAQTLMMTDTFVARTTPYNENPVTAVFDTRGLSKAIEPLREACGW